MKTVSTLLEPSSWPVTVEIIQFYAIERIMGTCDAYMSSLMVMMMMMMIEHPEDVSLE